MFLLQEVEDWYLELCEREPGLVGKVTEAVDALVAEGPMLVDHIKGSTLHTSGTQIDAGRHPLRILFVFERNAKRCFWWPATRPGIGGPWCDTKIPIAEYRYGEWIKKHEDE